MTRSLLILVLFCACRNVQPGPASYTITFSSCLQQGIDTSIWNVIAAEKSDLFLFTGDVIYADTLDMGLKRKAFARLNADPHYRKFKQQTRVLAVWDDHDYGMNDAGGAYPMKRQMQRIFLDAFDEPAASPRRKQHGIYTSEELTLHGKTIQIIVLDVRYFRTAWSYGPKIEPYSRTYREDARDSSTMLGAAQWKWLQEQVAQKADLRILVSSTPVLSDDYLGERWGAFPQERARLFRVMASAPSGKWLIVTGDRHFAQVLKRADVLPYPLIELTASGMNTVWPEGALEADRYREGSTLADANYGVLRFGPGWVQYGLHAGNGQRHLQGELEF